MSDERDAIQPELEIALAHFAQVYRKQQSALPLWLYECLTQYGIACCKRGVALAHRRRTVKQNPWDDEETPLAIIFEDEEPTR